MNFKRFQRMILGATLAATIGFFGMSGGTALAHNAGHVILPDDTCVNLGSSRSGPFVGESNPHYHAAPDQDEGQLDLIDGPGDQFGARFAATRGDSAVLPGNCPLT